VAHPESNRGGWVHEDTTPADTTVTKRPSGRGLVVAAAVLGIVAIVAAGSVLSWRASEARACDSIPVSLVSGGPDRSGATIPAEDVLVDERVSNMMASWNAPSVIVGRDGTAVALDSAAFPATAYRAGTISPATLDGLRRCVESDLFQELSGDYPMGRGADQDGRFCGIADLSTTVISAGPATASPKTVSAYALDQGGLCPGRPAALVDLHWALEEIRSEVVKGGAPTAAPTT
jgi:hypothetical protein